MSIKLPTWMATTLKDIVKDWRRCKILDSILHPNQDHPGERENGHYVNTGLIAPYPIVLLLELSTRGLTRSRLKPWWGEGHM